MLNNLKLPTIVIAAQIFALFVALAMLFGRVFFIGYYRVLGVPSPDQPSNIIAYAIISPDVTIACFGVAVLAITVFHSLKEETMSRPKVNKPWCRLIVSIGLSAIGLGVSYAPWIERHGVVGIPSLPQGFYGLVLVMALAALTYSAVILDGMWSRTTRSPSGKSLRRANLAMQKAKSAYGFYSMRDNKSGRQNNVAHANAKPKDNIKTGNEWLGLFATIVGPFLFVFVFSIGMAEREAVNQYRDAPYAELAMEYSRLAELDRSDDFFCTLELIRCRVGVVALQGGFLYVRPTYAENEFYFKWPTEMLTYAIPIDDVDFVKYQLYGPVAD